MGGDSEFSKLVRERKLTELAKKEQAHYYLVGLAFRFSGSSFVCRAVSRSYLTNPSFRW